MKLNFSIIYKISRDILILNWILIFINYFQIFDLYYNLEMEYILISCGILLILSVNYGKININNKIYSIFFILLLILISFNNFLSYNYVEVIYFNLIITSIILGVVIFVSNKDKFQMEIKKENFNLKKKNVLLIKNKIFYILFTIILFVAILLRLYKLGDLGYWVDESYHIISSLSILDNGLPLYNEDFLYYRGYFYTLSLSLSIYILGFSEFSVYIVPTVYSILTLILIFFIVKNTLSIEYALLASLIFTLNDFALLYSRYSRFYIALGFLIILNIYLFYKGFIEDKKKYKIYSIIVSFLIPGYESRSIIFLPILSFIYIIFSISSLKFRESIKYNLKKFKLFYDKYFWIYVIMGVLSFLLFNFLESLKGERTFREEKFNIMLPLPNFIIEFIYPTFDSFFFNFLINFFPLIFISIFIILISSLFIKTYSNNMRFLLFFNYYLFINLILLSIYTVNVQYFHWDQRHISFLFPLMVINLIIFFYFLFKNINKYKYFYYLFIIFLCIPLISIPNIDNVLNMKYGDNLLDTKYSVMKAETYRSDYKTIYEYVNDNYENTDIILVSKKDPYSRIYLTYNISEEFDNNDSISTINSKIDSGNRVWIIDISYDMKKYHAPYRWGEIYYFFERNKENIVYYGKDNKTRVFLFNN